MKHILRGMCFNNSIRRIEPKRVRRRVNTRISSTTLHLAVAGIRTKIRPKLKVVQLSDLLLGFVNKTRFICEQTHTPIYWIEPKRVRWGVNTRTFVTIINLAAAEIRTKIRQKLKVVRIFVMSSQRAGLNQGSSEISCNAVVDDPSSSANTPRCQDDGDTSSRRANANANNAQQWKWKWLLCFRVTKPIFALLRSLCFALIDLDVYEQRTGQDS